jgi:hypothetical protein
MAKTESKRRTCRKCGQRLLLLKPSPFQDGYYFYCELCPRRADVSIYDAVYNRIEAAARREHGSRAVDAAFFELVMPAVERRLSACRCRGHFRFPAALRCLSCGETLEGLSSDNYNVWFPIGEKDLGEEEEARGLIKNERLWKPSPKKQKP